ncbi:hypothetical protein CONCODRAFT_15197 [Conidiobolus coronatus NRRL 28638]|uniref:Uncharacterized protein n=1 Tax=Conidiobolus coronatus (strain ATCC 28846 / CBS 209.66 / NRRL 28638) TaxID=796925 RepID=A0A137PFU3_CONC2|nr:hypothetical protein CONCODRAFT_15197 [Conidiobolus coronatus NRRL 28638]|eukprot:KXN73845.1 hypothetical protein CONCODRAFT_15197 [Conidiobolus coronatus NRRL 28638]
MSSNNPSLYIELLNNINKLHVLTSSSLLLILGYEFVNSTVTIITQFNSQIQRSLIELPFELKSTRIKYPKPLLQTIIPLELKRSDSKLLSSELDIQDQLGLVWSGNYFTGVSFIGCSETKLPLIKGSYWKDTVPLGEFSGDDLADVMNRVSITGPASNNNEKEGEGESYNKLFSKVRNLPREGWEELVDCWVCHNEEYSTINSNNFSNQGTFFPPEGLLHVGTKNILFHPKHLINTLYVEYKKIVEEHMNSYSLTNPSHLNELIYLTLSCPHCLSQLGKIIIDPSQKINEEYAQVVSIPKFHLACQNLYFEESNNTPVEVLFLQDLYDLYQFNSMMKFIVGSGSSDGKDEGISIKITIMNWQIYLNDCELDKKTKLKPCTKFIYEIIDNKSDNIMAEGREFQFIEYPQSIINNLITKFKENTTYLSPQKRKFKESSISVLFWN